MQGWIPALQAARMADCHPTYFNAVINKGAIQSRRIAGRVFVGRRSFAEWLKAYSIRRHRRTPAEAVKERLHEREARNG